jgi:hypothetical protein
MLHTQRQTDSTTRLHRKPTGREISQRVQAARQDAIIRFYGKRG